MNVGALQYAYRGQNASGTIFYAPNNVNVFSGVLERKAYTGSIIKSSNMIPNTGNAIWGRTAAGIDPRLVNYVSANKGCTLSDFTNYYEAGLQPAGRIDYAALVRGATSFSDVFSDYRVYEKAGNCTVPAAYWQRNDFPFYRFFQEGTTADALNGWTPSAPNPPMDSALVQRNLSYITAGKMSIIIPEKLQEKMNADPAYAEEIYAKIAKWKTDYDRWDNATAASLGMNVAEHQYSKSYCLNLDEEGNVKNFVVTGGGGKIVGPSKEEQRQFEAEQAAKRKRRLEYQRALERNARKRAEMEKELEEQLAMEAASMSETYPAL